MKSYAASLRALAAALFLLSPAPFVAAASAQDLSQEQAATLARANSALNGMQQVAGKFVQVGPNGERAEGNFFLQRPGRLRFEYDSPSTLQIISDGFWVAVQDRKLKTTEKYPLAATPLKLILAKHVDLGRDAFVRDIHSQEGFVTVTLQERSGEAEGSLVLIFDSVTFDLRQWTVTDAQGLDTSVALSEIAAAGPFESKTFRINEIGTIEVQPGR
ncbi:MAG: outer-membrane lipoprotein carrier protein LolA [Rhodobiaceae bacterium]|nr:outer-membrane lipoprotein carrier protein LolA [Rhodobiaceae bacterium]